MKKGVVTVVTLLLWMHLGPVRGFTAQQTSTAAEQLNEHEFAHLMAEHHQAAIDIATLEEKSGASMAVKALARKIRRREQSELPHLQAHGKTHDATRILAQHKQVAEANRLALARLKGLTGAALAATEPNLLEHIPCYCGCVAEGHSSVLQCFVSSFRADGTPVWTNHSYTCPLCLHIAREVMLMSAMGKRRGDIRSEIDTRYKHLRAHATHTTAPGL